MLESNKAQRRKYEAGKVEGAEWGKGYTLVVKRVVRVGLSENMT